MNTRYALIGTALAVALAGPAYAQDAAPAGRARTVLIDTDYPGNGHKTQIVRVTVPPKARAPLHLHHGIESGYIIRGGGTLHIQGRAPITMKPGMTQLVPPNTPHWFQNGDAETQIVSTYVVESDTPVTTLIQK